MKYIHKCYKRVETHACLEIDEACLEQVNKYLSNFVDFSHNPIFLTLEQLKSILLEEGEIGDTKTYIKDFFDKAGYEDVYDLLGDTVRDFIDAYASTLPTHVYDSDTVDYDFEIKED